MKKTNFSIKGSQILKEVEQSRIETKNVAKTYKLRYLGSTYRNLYKNCEKR